MITLYGIKACDTMKKARTWLDEHGVDYQFHDYKTQGIDAERLHAWCTEHGWEIILNRSLSILEAMAWGSLPSRKSCSKLILQHPM